jgi:hypothetical protein
MRINIGLTNFPPFIVHFVFTKPANRSCPKPGELNPNSRAFFRLGIKTITAEEIGSMLITHYTFLSTDGTKCIYEYMCLEGRMGIA